MLTDDDMRARLTEAFHEHADPVAGQPLGTAGLYARGQRRRRQRVAVRAVCALAAVSLAVGAWTTLGPGTGSPGSRPATSGPGTTAHTPVTGLLLAAAIARPQSAAAAQAGLPPYYVVTDADPKQTLITQAGNDHTFVLALAGATAQFDLLHVTRGGHSAQLTPLPVPALPAGEYVSAIAVSPDGRELAIALQADAARHWLIEVVTLPTGTVRTWSLARSGLLTQMSWARNDRSLGYFWVDDAPGRANPGGLWVLNTTAPGRSLLSGRRVLPATVGDDQVQTALLSPGGATAIASVTYNGVHRVAAGTVVGGIVEVSVKTGRPLQTLLAEHAADSADPGHPGWYVTACQLPAIDPSGQHLLVSCDKFGRLDRARFTALPGSAPQVAVAAAW
jgi:hypothetical protein